MNGGRRRPARRQRRHIDPVRRAAFDALRAVSAHDAYANLIGAEILGERKITGRDAAFATELINGTCRLQGTYDRIIVAASGRELKSLQPAVVDVLRLACHQLLSMRVPTHAAVTASVDLAATAIAERVTGLVNAITRKIAAHGLDGWINEILASNEELAADPLAVLALRTHHPRWIVAAYADVLPADELEPALLANNIAPVTSLAIRPGLCTVDELVEAGAEPNDQVSTAAFWHGNPADVAAVRQGRAGVSDPGSQFMANRLAAADKPAGPWLDLCAGPGGKAALLAGHAIAAGERLTASELRPHRAELVSKALRCYAGPEAPDPELAPRVLTADATNPPWQPGSFALVMADVPCTGLGALRRRPESRWRRTEDDLADLVALQRSILNSAIDSAAPGGVVGYVTCSPHRAETTEVVDAVLASRDDVERIEPDRQLWPHRDGTDAMFGALLRRR